MIDELKNKVQIQVRLTADEREEIKYLAEENNQSMNQYILDKVLSENSKDDSTQNSDSYENHSMMLAYLKDQIIEKDQQISALNMRLEESYKLINQQQQLSLLQQQPLKITEDDKERNEENDKHSKRWWQRIWS
ncbi:hypothetical protein [Aerococcus suis]|uniref:DUF536 domain-containing protein n=1 Tax=Aerococcus suis TaxID=371602 RepID=A0A1W1ZJ48_9LACT|nr:hypothetical protein [Aerococcus suis]SMC48416.1 hypothetical protein SAMN04487984_1350 [Aerococcus suis]